VRSFSAAKTRLDQLSGVRDWRLHDLRRTAASGMARLGVAPHILAEVLNHARVGVTAAVYLRHTYLAEKREALNAWAAEVERLLE
jgi:integrase